MRQLLGIFIGAIVITFMLYGCTENTRARNWGGTETITLEKGTRVITVTWKDGADLWILTKKDTTKPSTYEFTEKSNIGMLQGKVIISEQ